MKKYLLSLGMLLTVSVSVPFVTYAEGMQNAHVHEMGQWSVVPATCGKDGYRIRTCTYCSYSEKKTIPATGQSFNKMCDDRRTDLYLSRICGRVLYKLRFDYGGNGYGAD